MLYSENRLFFSFNALFVIRHIFLIRESILLQKFNISVLKCSSKKSNLFIFYLSTLPFFLRSYGKNWSHVPSVFSGSTTNWYRCSIVHVHSSMKQKYIRVSVDRLPAISCFANAHMAASPGSHWHWSGIHLYSIACCNYYTVATIVITSKWTLGLD